MAVLSLSHVIVLTAAGVIGVYLFYKHVWPTIVWIWRSYWAFKKIVRMPSLPLIGGAHLIPLNYVEFYFHLRYWMCRYLAENDRFSKSGTAVGFWLGPVPIVFLAAFESIQPLLESNTLITKAAQYNTLIKWLGTGLLTSTGTKWFSRRKLLTPTFHFKVLAGYSDVFQEQGDVLMNLLEKYAESGEEFDLYPYMKRCALDIISETAMGTKIHAQAGRNVDYVNAVSRLTQLSWDKEVFIWNWLKPVWYMTGSGFEFDRLVKLATDFTRKVIADRKEKFQHDATLEELAKLPEEEILKKKLAFLDMLILMQKTAKLSDEDIREEVDIFMFEGHDTTATAMSFAVWHIGQNERVQKKIHAELDEVFGTDDRVATMDDIRKLPYLEMCIKETLRLSPSVPLFARVLTHDLEVPIPTGGKATIPEGTTVIAAPMAAHRDPRVYERPEEFYPEHFDPAHSTGRSPYAYTPFSAGPRNCIGQKFAIVEEKFVLSAFFRRFRVKTLDLGEEGNTPQLTLILKPSNGCRIVIEKRQAGETSLIE